MHQQNLDNALLSIVKLPYPEVTKQLIKDGANVNCKSSFDTMPIQYAIQYNQLSQIEILIASGISYSMVDILRYAILWDKKSIVTGIMDKYLLINIFEQSTDGIYIFYMLCDNI